MWKTLRTALKPLDPIRVENRVLAGTPDVNLAGGAWIELKYVKRKPKNEEKIFVIPHYTPQQRLFSKRRERAKGKTFVLIKIANEWILLQGGVAAIYLNKVSLTQLKKVAIKIWKKTVNPKEIQYYLTQ